MRGDTGPIGKIRRESKDSFDIALANQVAANLGLGIARNRRDAVLDTVKSK